MLRVGISADCATHDLTLRLGFGFQDSTLSMRLTYRLPAKISKNASLSSFLRASPGATNISFRQLE
jgi:hypothetical protein